MAEGGKILAEILKKLADTVRPGITTKEIDKLAGELILFYAKQGEGRVNPVKSNKVGAEQFHRVRPAFLGYGGYPANVCTSVNDEVVHCVPSDRELKEGEILSLDMGIKYQNFYLDSAVTLPVLGETSPVGDREGSSRTKQDAEHVRGFVRDSQLIESEDSSESERRDPVSYGMSYKNWAKLNPKLYKLLEVTRESLNAGIKQAKVGNRIGDISHAVQSVIEKNKFNVIRELVGHGIGRNLHEEPQVPNFGRPDEGVKLEEGMVIAIEPMVSLGDWRLVKGADGFTYKTKDGSYAAHFEHTVAVTKEGPLVLT